ncbi:hypothetical protein XELAEV_18012951mg [Xenopus laevis]|uniref:Uncharacterized protein n=1 Tax=Xenopus laevis TaxID=8355 RepID=A0A974HZ60_XENLA|nr:hypothetical protein XELAEV_18012951mg [Xenopus laevis]
MSWICWVLVFCTAKYTAATEAIHFGLNCLNKEQTYRYQVFDKENVFIPCGQPYQEQHSAPVCENCIQWFLEKDGELNEIGINKHANITKKGNTLLFSPAEIHHSGVYICKMDNVCLRIILDVRTKDICLTYEPSSKYVLLNIKNTISCPSQNCHHGLNKSGIKWYKNGKKIIEKPTRTGLKLTGNGVVITETYSADRGLYTCDYSLYLNGSLWTVRATVDVEVAAKETEKKPEILHPKDGDHVEAELGKPLKLECRVVFGYERYLNAGIDWIKLHPGSKEEKLERTHLEAPKQVVEGTGTTYILTSTLHKVSIDDFNSTFLCRVRNFVGTATSVVKLIRKKTGSGLIYLHWTEIVLLYRNYLSKDETLGDDKEFDAFVSYAKHDSDSQEETFEDSYGEEVFATQFLPSVLEDKYNFKLCLLERDILPGGAYVEDVVKIIKRSRRVIVILSQRYITSPSVFELQAAVTCSLEEEPIKLILVKFSPFKEPESLPHIVKKALNALPRLEWKGKLDSSASIDTKFWNKVRYHMPVKNNKKQKKMGSLLK